MSGTVTAKTVQKMFPQGTFSDSYSISQSSSSSLQFPPLTYQTYKEIQDQLDISSNTKPDELCFNCIRKHLGLAYMFASQGGDQRCRTALGQLMCISLHLRNSFPNLSYKVQDIALRLLRQSDKSQWPAVIGELIPVFIKDPEKDSQQHTPLPVLIQEQQLLILMMLYSLLFVEITYEPQNVFWATANLSAFAYKSFGNNKSLQQYQSYRSLWKLIQSMELLDENYVAARDYLLSLIASKYPLYIGITVPQKQALFKRQYKEQQESLKKFQKDTQENKPS